MRLFVVLNADVYNFALNKDMKIKNSILILREMEK